MSKYNALRDLLRQQGRATVSLTLAEIANAVPGGLPASAHRHRAWWSNQSGSSHVQARSWLDAGYSVAGVDMAGSVVTFERLLMGEQ